MFLFAPGVRRENNILRQNFNKMLGYGTIFWMTPIQKSDQIKYYTTHMFYKRHVM